MHRFRLPNGATRPGLALLTALALALTGTAAAFTPTLSPSDVQAALEQGQVLAEDQQGYDVQDWVLYDVADPFTIEPDQGEVEAVVVGTPFERLRYRSYLQSFQHADQPLAPEEGQRIADELANGVTFVVFAHAPGSGEEDRDFLQRFANVTFAPEGGDPLSPSETRVQGTAQDFYNVRGGATEFRWLGVVSFRFDLAALAQDGADASQLTGTLSFEDSQGRSYSFDVDLSAYR